MSLPNRTRFVVKTFNKISPGGLARFRPEMYRIKPSDAAPPVAHAILLRSHKIQDEDVPLTCRAIARCGAGTNNCNVPRMTELGVPVFNTPGANANAVKELVLCGLFLASRGIMQGAFKMDALHAEGTAHDQIEKVKAQFGGRELAGKTLGVVGLGAIGAAVAHSAIALGMKVVGHDPGLSVEAALRLPSGDMDMASLEDLVAGSDYVTLHAPYIKDVTHHLIGEALIKKMKPDASLLNFARGELVDEDALNARYEAGGGGRYITDFAVGPDLWPRTNVITIPHLGASTEEAEENAAAMAADTIQLFLETGTIRDSVNFPACALPARDEEMIHRVCVVTENRPGMLGELMSVFGGAGINVSQQINTSKGEIAYNVVDLELPRNADGKPELSSFKSFDELQAAIMELDGVKSSRLISDWCPGTGYAIKAGGEVIGIGVDSPEQESYAALAA
mmetsp:Transcript_34015/g.102483  ORF Transcript_34015/g.102483 Transcript_34015/m.102483 type:complete len:450 (+) Transcript_34015:158-1507(+)